MKINLHPDEQIEVEIVVFGRTEPILLTIETMKPKDDMPARARVFAYTPDDEGCGSLFWSKS